MLYRYSSSAFKGVGGYTYLYIIICPLRNNPSFQFLGAAASNSLHLRKQSKLEETRYENDCQFSIHTAGSLGQHHRQCCPTTQIMLYCTVNRSSHSRHFPHTFSDIMGNYSIGERNQIVIVIGFQIGGAKCGEDPKRKLLPRILRSRCIYRSTDCEMVNSQLYNYPCMNEHHGL